MINNPGRIPAIVADHGSLSNFVGSFAPESHTKPRSLDDLYDRSKTSESKALANGLKSYGFRFIGPTTAYAARQCCLKAGATDYDYDSVDDGDPRCTCVKPTR